MATMAQIQKLKAQKKKPSKVELVQIWKWIQTRCFPKQLDLIKDPSTSITACCGRRAGKTEAAVWKMLYTGFRHPGSAMVYITREKEHAKRVFWSRLKEAADSLQFKLSEGPSRKSEASLSFTLPTGASIYLLGCRDVDGIDKARGMGLSAAFIDEAHLVGANLADLIDEVLEYALVDYNGWKILSGTPGKVKAGPFYKTLQNPDWSHHSWTMFDNPHIERLSKMTPQQVLEKICKTRGVTVDDPTIQREFFARWVEDISNLAVKFSSKNCIDAIPDCKEYYMGVDIGWEDKDAIVIWGVTDNNVYLTEEWAENHQTLTKLEDKIEYFQNKYNPVRIACDQGGGGKKIIESMAQRPRAIFMEGAAKQHKVENIELMNDYIQNGFVKVLPDSLLVEDTSKIEWAPRKKNGIYTGERVLSDRFHSDILDAALYGFRTIPLDFFAKPEVDESKLKEKRLMEWMRAMGSKAGDTSLGLLPNYLQETDDEIFSENVGVFQEPERSWG